MHVVDRIFRSDSAWNLMIVHNGCVRTSISHALITIRRSTICRWRVIFAEGETQRLFPVSFIGRDGSGYRPRNGCDDEKKMIHYGEESGSKDFELCQKRVSRDKIAIDNCAAGVFENKRTSER